MQAGKLARSIWAEACASDEKDAILGVQQARNAMTACTYLATISVAMATAGRRSRLTFLVGARHRGTAARGGNCFIVSQTLTLLGRAGEVYACSRELTAGLVTQQGMH